MKKIIILILIMLTCRTFAAPIGNPLNPEIIADGFFISPASWLNFRLGYEGNFVSDSRMDKKVGSGKVDNFKQDINSGTITFNLQNRTDVFGVLGASRLRSDWRFDNLGTMSRIELETNYRLYWAVGGKIILYQWGSTALSIGGRFSKTKPTLSFITQDGVPQNIGSTKISYRDWQVDMGLAHQIDIFIPYLGVKYLNAKSKIRNSVIALAEDSQNFMRMKNEDHFGVYLGCTLSNSKYFLLTVEARFIDEEAISVMGELKF